jgi:hypothetical protein
MQHTITPRNVMAIILEVDACLKAKSKDINFNTVETMIALQELVGRIIVDMAITQVSADELTEHCKKHLDDTIRIGMQVKGRSAYQA